ncbi:MAG: BamA/TamA family outer membrane protein [Ferruginibacter sp.]
MIKNLFIIIICVVIASSCSVQKYLPPGERLYRGATVHVEKDPEVTTRARSLKSTILLAATPKANKFLLGQPWKVWWYYKLGESEHVRGLRRFLRNRLGEPPVLSSRINTNATAENMQALLENLGYFHSTVTGDTTNYSYFTKAIYEAKVKPLYHLNKIEWVNDSTELMNTLTYAEGKSLLVPGNAYRLSDISSERDRLDLYLKTKGYYYFNPDYLMSYADSTVGDRKVNLYLNIKTTTPENAKHPYTISNIIVFPNYTLTSADLDTSRAGAEYFDGIMIKDSVHKFKPDLFATTITYRQGAIYNSETQNSTLNRFINLKTFKFVKNRFSPYFLTDSSHLLDVYYYLTPSKQKSLQGQIDAFSKENQYVGGEASIFWKNRNLFRGAEQLSIRGYGGYEVSYADSLKNNNNFRLGAEATLTIPRYALPFFKISENNFYPPNTNLTTGYEYFRKQLFYTKNFFRFQYDFTWKPSLRKQYKFAPISLSYLNATQVSDSFYKQAAITPSILLNVFSEAVLGSFLNYTYNNSLNPLAINRWYLNTGVDVSGNLYGLFIGAKNYREKLIFGTPFAQYVKLDFDLHYTRTLRSKIDWANRIQLGAGLPYNNSRLLPFAKQYSIGGSNSIRGFRSRSLGPGSYLPTAEDQRFFQIIGGDYKLLANTELRIPLVPRISFATFIDAGNIWTKDTLLFGHAGQLSKDWLKEIAVASGVGIRFDAVVILIRADLGIPLRKPYLPEGQRWVLNKIDFTSGPWRRENLILNIAIGLPF